VSIPATVGLDEQDRRQLERLINPVFRLWLERRIRAVGDLFSQWVCEPALRRLEPGEDVLEPQIAAARKALSFLEASL
jgi:hypothetical protein